MKTLAKRICFLALVATLLETSICHGESIDADMRMKRWNEIRWKVGQITIDEAKVIEQIEDMANRYNNASNSEKQRILDGLCSIYHGNDGDFLGIVVLEKLASLGRLGILSDPNDRFLAFAQTMQNDEKGIATFLGEVNDPGVEGFLKSWYAHQRDIESLSKEFESLRNVKIRQIKTEIQTQINDSNTPRAELLFGIIENWRSPLEYEACFPLILDEYEANPEHVLNLLRQLFLKYTPNQAPPPYEKVHTIFQELCFITIAINDKSLLDVIEPLSNSSNLYVKYKCSMTLKWLKDEVRYPIEYDGIKRAYDSRS